MTLSDKDVDKIDCLILCEGLEVGLRHFHQDLDDIKDKKFRQLLNRFLEAAEDLEDYLIEQGVDIDE